LTPGSADSGTADLWTAAAIGNTGSLINQILAEFNDDLSGDGQGGLGNGGDNDGGKAGFIGTVRGGFDYQLDSIVLGLDAAFNFGKTEIEANATGAAGGDISVSGDETAEGEGFGEANISSSLELGNSWSIGGRAGFLATESTLIFGSAGYVSTHAELKASFNGRAEAEASGDGDASGSAEAGFDISSSDSDWLDGYYVGAGIEQLLTSNISLKLEYRYSDLGSIETSNSEVLEDGDDFGDAYWETGVGAEAEPTVHSVMATINWRF
jgi:outer membrane immunogenic protein